MISPASGCLIRLDNLAIASSVRAALGDLVIKMVRFAGAPEPALMAKIFHGSLVGD
jgi:hypothetical protein